MAKTLDYDFTAPQFNGTTGIEAQTGPDLTVTRASDATVMDYFNVLKTVNDNEPRFTGGRRVENVALHSQDFSTDWVNSGTIDYQASGTAPDGTNTANLVEGTGGGVGKIWVAQTWVSSYLEGGQYTLSMYAKADGLDWLRVSMQDYAPGTGYCFFDLANGLVGSSALIDGAGIEAATVTYPSAPAGWYRVWVTQTITAADLSGQSRISPADADNDWDVTKDDTSSLFLWGVQLEKVAGQDDPAPSEYIATTTAAKAQWYATKRRTNFGRNTEDMTAATWVENRGSWLADQIVAPDGETTADKFVENTATGTHGPYQSQSYKNGEVYTSSIHVKAGERTSVVFQVGGTAAPGTCNISVVDLTDGSGGTPGAGADDGGVIDVGNGWYRLWITWTADATSTAYPLCSMYTGGTTSYTGDGSSGMYFWGLQCEQGTLTDYVPNSGGSGTVASSSFDTAITPTGLLIEESRTNLLLQSEDFSSDFSVGAGTLNVNQVNGPTGTLTADELVDDGAATQAQIFQNITISSAQDYVLSVYVKAGGLSWVALRTSLFDSATNGYTYFDLSGAGAVGTQHSGHTGAGIDSGADGWYRVWIAFQSVTDVAGRIQIYCAEADNDIVIPATGTSSIYLWGAQLEAGSFPTSYIPTTTASVTRNADVVSTTTVDWINAGAGTYYTDFSMLDRSTIDTTVGVISGQASKYICYFSPNNDFRTYDGTNIMDWDTNYLVASDSPTKAALGYADADLTMTGYFNGAAAADNPEVYATGAFDSVTTFYVGNRSGVANTQLNGHIARIAYYDERLTDAQLEDLSNGTFPVAESNQITFVRNVVRNLVTAAVRNVSYTA